MAEVSDVVVKGTIAGFEPGPIYYGDSLDEPGAVPSTLMMVKVSEVLEGQLGSQTESVPVEIFGVDPESAAEVGPVGADTLIYLKQLPETGFVESSKDVAPPPGQDGEPIYGFSRVQGFLVDDGSAIVQPAGETEFPNADFEDFEPTDKRFPPETDGTETSAIAG